MAAFLYMLAWGFGDATRTADKSWGLDYYIMGGFYDSVRSHRESVYVWGG